MAENNRSDLEKQTDDNSTSIKLIQQDIGYMKTGIDNIQNDIKSLKDTIDDGYTRKDEHQALIKRVESIENLKEWAIKIIVGAIILSLLAFIGFKQ